MKQPNTGIHIKKKKNEVEKVQRNSLFIYLFSFLRLQKRLSPIMEQYSQLALCQCFEGGL